MCKGTYLRWIRRIGHQLFRSVWWISPCSSWYMFPRLLNSNRHPLTIRRLKTSLDDNALLVKSLTHVLKHFSTKFEYIRRKSCIYLVVWILIQRENASKYTWRFSITLVIWACSAGLKLEKSIARFCLWENGGWGTRIDGGDELRRTSRLEFPERAVQCHVHNFWPSPGVVPVLGVRFWDG